VNDYRTPTLKLLEYCRSRDWAGHDPYDAMNSRLFAALPFLDHRVPRIALTQLLKRSPVNLRSLLLIPPTQNSKALGLFLQSLLNLHKAGLAEAGAVHEMADKIAGLRAKDTNDWCWGYSFAWQTRSLIVPRGVPNLVCTTFVANALLDAYEFFREERYLEMALSAAEYIRRDLFWSVGDESGFCYPYPNVPTRVHNANLLAAGLLCRVAHHSGEKKFLVPAFRAARYSAGKQAADGSWQYGELPTQQWVDNFHTGYNLSGLRAVNQYAGTDEFESHIRRGFEFYRRHFFREDGAPRYFHNKTYPIDAHCVSQSILTPLEFADLHPGNVELARRVADWALANMWDERGFFYYRVLPYCTIKTSYMRWVQAWMLLALTTLVEQTMPARADKALAAA
jgi:hypothetical protein